MQCYLEIFIYKGYHLKKRATLESAARILLTHLKTKNVYYLLLITMFVKH
jgi:hypothetical protein